jgi:predicted AlkP superfamily pyrophosphatase or phosphodiesterase
VTHRAPVLVALLVVLAACGRGEGPREEGGGAQPTASAALRTPKVLVIGIDGVRPDVLAEVGTPAIDALAAEGTFTDAARTGLPSVSGPGWSSLLTGVWPAKHGVTNNDFTGKRYDAFPDFLTRIEQVRPALRTFAVADWKPLVEAEDGVPTIGDAVDEKHVLDGYELGWAEADERSVALAVTALAEGDPDALFVYLGNPDEVSHETAAIGEEYRAAIAEADRQVGRLVDAVRARATWSSEDWLVLMSTDHGRLPNGDHGGDTPEERTIFYLASGPATARGRPSGEVHIVDVAVTALTHLGIVPDTAWDLDGKAVGLR